MQLHVLDAFLKQATYDAEAEKDAGSPEAVWGKLRVYENSMVLLTNVTAIYPCCRLVWETQTMIDKRTALLKATIVNRADRSYNMSYTPKRSVLSFGCRRRAQADVRGDYVAQLSSLLISSDVSAQHGSKPP